MKKPDLEHVIATLALHDFLLAQIVVNSVNKEPGPMQKWEAISRALLIRVRSGMEEPELEPLRARITALAERFCARVGQQVGKL